MSIKINNQIKIRVYYEDTDAGGIVYHSKYLNFAERARTEFLRKINFEQHTIKEEYGKIFVVKSLNVDYLNFARLDDLLIVKTKICDLNKAKINFQQFIFKEQLIIAKLKVKVCCINKNGKISRMNDKMYDTLKLTEKETI